METSLNDILSDEHVPAEQQPEQTPEPEPQTEAQPRDEHGRFVQKGVEAQELPAEAVPPAASLPKDVYEPLRAVRDENRALKERLAALEAKTAEPPAPPPSLWEDEQAWQQHFGGEVVNAAVQQATLNAQLNVSEMLARREHQDFDDMKARFLEMAGNNPSLRDKALNDPDPWGAAYRIAKNAAAMEELGATDLDTLKAKLRDELLAELQAAKPARSAVPPTLSNERSIGSRSGPSWTGPTPLSELLR